MQTPSTKVWDIAYVRQQFPALNDPESGKLAFFENAGGTYVPHQVVEHLNHFMTHTKVQPYGPYRASQQGTQAIEQATVKMAEMVNADEDEVVIGHCTTMNLYLLSMALRKQFAAGDEIIVTEQDHESNISPWLRLQEFGVKVRFWPIDPHSGKLALDDLDTLLGERTRLVCMTHSSNIVGDVNDVKAVADKVHAVGGWLLVDGVSYAPHHAIDVKALGVDVYVLSLYKLFGPHLGLMYVRRDLHGQLHNQSLEQLPKLYAAYTNPGAPNNLRIALNPGLVNHEEVACLLGLVAYFDDLHQHHGFADEPSFQRRVSRVMAIAGEHETALARQWQIWLKTQPALSQLGGDNTVLKQRSPTWALQCGSTSPRTLAIALGEREIAVQSGSFYAWRCLEKLGVDPHSGVLRVSLAHFNSSEELMRLCITLDGLLESAGGKHV